MTDHASPGRRLDEVTDAVRALAEVMRANGLTKINIEFGDVAIALSAAGSREVVARSAGRVEPVVVPVPVAEAPSESHVITAPMIGTFYLTPAPGEPPFVRVGERVEAGQTIGIIEAMKIMNEIPADRTGVVTEILVTNAQAVEYGSPLLKIVPDGAGG